MILKSKTEMAVEAAINVVVETSAGVAINAVAETSVATVTGPNPAF